ncbi:hypothetical protein [Roseateles saccharophilus]|uniref:Uncharacterized protein n=1 Tax=Roseateles saccharophilus TaxID=304 RepID=A0A4R3V9W8_ROSSA|nr:hypothetical protein [Roseateles saccharophilus]MDG0832945.1 hypothetical protein [Roseateles saccharophilus]TCV02037.1 hypothetical protein EV671_100572 [Roseateles saccharophilus]
MAHELDFAALSLDDAVPADLGAYEAAQARRQYEEADARNRALEFKAQACDNAAEACWYLARSLGAARDLPQDGEASLELLFQLIGALADLPADIATAPLPEVVGGRNDGITELCQQLEAAREVTEEVLIGAELAPARAQFCH